jgi:hypothetical protein
MLWKKFRSLEELLILIILPIMVHMMPYPGNDQLGAMILPLFIAPLVAALHQSIIGLIAACVFAPILNYYLTGMPTLESLPVIIIELIIFGLIVLWGMRNKPGFLGLFAIAFIVSKVLGMIISTIILGELSFSHFISLFSEAGTLKPEAPQLAAE